MRAVYGVFAATVARPPVSSCMPPISGLRRIVVADRLQRGHELRAAPPLNGAEPRNLNNGGHIERAYRLF